MISKDTNTETLELCSLPRHFCLEIQDCEKLFYLPIAEGSYRIGSSRHADIVLQDRTVSSVHCVLEVSHSRIVVRDENSKNGTFIGGASVKEAVLWLGSSLVIGSSTLRIVSQEKQSSFYTPVEIPGMIGSSQSFLKVLHQIKRIANTKSPVLITGETGTGKELIAKALHTESARKQGPYVTLNMANLPKDLVESELFGHERGSFTGAHQKRLGAFAEASGGSLFLDEIGELPLEAQPKLLRALDGYEIRSVGSAGSFSSQARVIAATHVPLEERVYQGLFRRDLFHRLEVYVIEAPPLRERTSDIPLLARHLLALLAPEIGQKKLSPSAIAGLVSYDWPGNIRELRNTLIKSAYYADDSGIIDSSHLSQVFQKTKALGKMAMNASAAKSLLKKCQGNISLAARLAEMPRTSFRRYLDEPNV